MNVPAAHGLTALRFLWEQYEDTVKLEPAPEETWLEEFFFCLLGGYGIPFELNRSAFRVLKVKGYFHPQVYCGEVDTVRDRLESELKARQFTPMCKNGEMRSYRFPHKKADTLVQAGRWLLETCDFQLSGLLGTGPKHDREVLVGCPGFGYKTASWFLRNIGQGDGLAILDIHVYRTLRDFCIIPPELSIGSDYLKIEQIFCEACDTIEVEADVMDLIVWSWARGGIHGSD
jgi:N-glycosylase/DNA lyase